MKMEFEQVALLVSTFNCQILTVEVVPPDRVRHLWSAPGFRAALAIMVDLFVKLVYSSLSRAWLWRQIGRASWRETL